MMLCLLFGFNFGGMDQFGLIQLLSNSSGSIISLRRASSRLPQSPWNRSRLRIYEETKNLTPEERAKHTNKAVRQVAAEYDLTFAPSKRSSEGSQFVDA
jgi:hypothetical protein